jgi:hypothetical protein
MVPEPITRSGGRPEIRWAAKVMTSTGLVAISRIASGAACITPAITAEHRDIALEQRQPVFAGLLADARGDDHHSGVPRSV